MKKVLKIIGIVFLIIVMGIVVLFAIISNMQSAPKEYWEKINSNSDIENKYNKLGK